MRTEGYIPTTEAERLVGFAGSTFYNWIRDGRLRATRSGHFWWIELESLLQVCPHIRAKVESERKTTNGHRAVTQ